MHDGHAHHAYPTPGLGHNHAAERRPSAQWQTPHREEPAPPAPDHGEPDLDLVETAFVDGFATTADPTSFLRLARVPFDVVRSDGIRLVLLRVETEAVTDVGGIMPQCSPWLDAGMALRRSSAGTTTLSYRAFSIRVSEG